MSTVVTIPYAPRDWAIPFHESTQRWKVLVCHRRAGKTVAALNHLLRDALRTPRARFAYIAPTYKQGKNIAWDYLKLYARPIPGTQFNEAELRADLPNGSRITIYGADNPDTLRGIALWGVVFDEYSQQPANIFSEIIRPSLADHQGYAIWIGTPKGKNEFWRLYETHLNDPDWFTLRLTASISKVLPETELESSKKTMTKEEYEQEYECSPIAFIKGAYYTEELAKARAEKRFKPLVYEKEFPVYTVWDIGMGDSTSIGFFQRLGGYSQMVDYYEMTGMGLDHYAKVLIDKGYTYSHHVLPHDIKVRDLSASDGKSRLEVLQALLPGHEIKVLPALPLEDGINAVRLNFHRLYVDSGKCTKAIDAWELYRKDWDEKGGLFRPKPVHDWTSHASDMLRYWAIEYKDDTIQEENDHYDYRPPSY